MRSPYLTTAEAQRYLGYHTPGGIRMAVYRGWLQPVGRGPRRTWLFTVETIDAFVALRARATVPSGCRLVRDTKEDRDEAHQDEEEGPARDLGARAGAVSHPSAGGPSADRADDRREEEGSLRIAGGSRGGAGEAPGRESRRRRPHRAEAGSPWGLRQIVAEWTAANAEAVHGGKVR